MICERWASTVLMLNPRPWAISRVDLPRTTRREVVVVDDRGGRGLIAYQRLADHGVGNRRAQVALVIAQRQQCLLQFVGAGVLEQVAMGAGLQGSHDQLRVGVHRQDQHLALGVGRLELVQRIQAAGVFHRQVQQHDIRQQGAECFQHLRAIAGFANHRVAGNVQDQRADAGPDQCVVIHQE